MKTFADAMKAALDMHKLREQAAADIARRTGAHPEDVYRVLVDLADDGVLAERIVVRAREMNVEPTALSSARRRS